MKMRMGWALLLSVGCLNAQEVFPDQIPSVCDDKPACPQGMVRFWAFGEGSGLGGRYHIEGGECFCIDRYEASEGPEGIPQSVANEMPWTNLSFNEAATACEAAGKRLCQNTEWEAACKGFPERAYPYGNSPDFSICNVGPTIEPTGSFEGCEGGVPGMFDMSGNVAEWTRWDGLDGCHPVFECRAYGGSAAANSGGALQCGSRRQLDPDDDRARVIGFRCCTAL